MLKDISGKKKYFNNVQPTCCIRANCSWRDNTTLKLSWSLSHCWKQTNRELNKHIEHCLLDNPLRASQNRKKKINVWNGCLGGGGGWDSAGGIVFTVDCFKTSPAIIEPIIWFSNAMQMQLHNEDGFKITFLLKIYLSETLTPQNNSRSLSHLWQFHF